MALFVHPDQCHFGRMEKSFSDESNLIIMSRFLTSRLSRDWFEMTDSKPVISSGARNLHLLAGFLTYL
jgi:hypothetical protein